MCLLKKLSVVLPVFAVGLFVFTLVVLNKQHSQSNNAAVTVFTSDNAAVTHTGSAAVSEKAEEHNTTVQSSVTTHTDVCVTTVSVPQTSQTSLPGVTAVVVTPYSKKQVADAPQTLVPEPVVTPYEIILESITLVRPGDTLPTETTTEEETTEPTEPSEETDTQSQPDNTDQTDSDYIYQAAYIK